MEQQASMETAWLGGASCTFIILVLLLSGLATANTSAML
jgi:hypothetical protein